MQNTTLSTGAIALGTTAEDILNPPTLTGGAGIAATETFMRVKQVIVTNTSASARELSMFIGATEADAAGTEFLASALEVAPNVTKQWFTDMPLTAADFLTAKADAAGLTLTVIYEIGIRL